MSYATVLYVKLYDEETGPNDHVLSMVQYSIYGDDHAEMSGSQ